MARTIQLDTTTFDADTIRTASLRELCEALSHADKTRLRIVTTLANLVDLQARRDAVVELIDELKAELKKRL